MVKGNENVFNRNRISAGLLILFVVSMIPLIVVAQYALPQADDFVYGLYPHLALEQSQPLAAVFREAARTVREYYRTWQGTYTSIFLMSLQPGIFGEQYYFIGPCLIYLALCLATAYFTKTLLLDILKTDRGVWLAVTAGLLLLSIQEIPDPAQAFYWFNGAIHYTGTHILLLLMMGANLSVLSVRLGKKESHGRAYWAARVFGLCALGLLLGGGNYVGVLEALLLEATLILALLIGKARREAGLLFPAALTLAAGAAVNMTAPGNVLRGGSLNKWGQILPTVFKCFRTGAEHILDWTGWFALLIAAVLIPFLWLAVRRSTFRFPLPGIVLLYSYCLLSAMFAPNIYVSGEADMERPQNAIYYIYCLLLLLNTAYLLGWLNHKAIKENRAAVRAARFLKHITECPSGYYAALLAIGILGAGIAVYRQPIHFTSSSAMVSLLNGNAASDARKVQSNIDILKDMSTEEAVILPLGERPSILHSEEIDLWDSGTRRFYHKEKVTVAGQ